MSLITPPEKPVPDGVMTVHFTNGMSRDFPHKIVVFIREEMLGLRIVYEEDGRRKVSFWPWASIFEIRNQLNDEEYSQKLEAWMEYETVVAATEGRTPVFAEHQTCMNCATETPSVITNGLLS